MGHVGLDEKHFPKGAMHVGILHALDSLIPFGVEYEAVRKAVHDQDGSGWIALGTFAFESLNNLIGQVGGEFVVRVNVRLRNNLSGFVILRNSLYAERSATLMKQAAREVIVLMYGCCDFYEELFGSHVVFD
jgi:hypothetical protein